MKARLIVAAVGVPLLLALLLLAPDYILASVLALALALAAYELVHAAGGRGWGRRAAYASIFAAGIPGWVYLGGSERLLFAAFFLLTALVFADAILSYRGAGGGAALQLMATLFAAAAVPLMFCAVLRIRLLPQGVYLVLLPFVAAYCCDTGAFFTGRAFGRRKLIEHVSPNKTVAGAYGGLAGSVAGMLIYALALSLLFDFQVNYLLALLYGLLSGALAQVGDLAFSLLKREFGVKDYGHLLPGHGGILDRIDSVVFTAPLLYCLLLWLPAFAR